ARTPGGPAGLRRAHDLHAAGPAFRHREFARFAAVPLSADQGRARLRRAAAMACDAAQAPPRGKASRMTDRPAAGMTIYFLGDDAVLFHEPRQELHALNTMAAVIWCHLEDGGDHKAIAGEL